MHSKAFICIHFDDTWRGGTRPETGSQPRWLKAQANSLCVLLISGAGHALVSPSCAETCLQAFRNRFLSWGALLLDTQGRVFSCQASSHIFVTIVVLVVDHLLVRNWSYLFPPLVSASGVFSWRDSVTFASSRPTTRKVSSRKLSICAGNYAQGWATLMIDGPKPTVSACS